jgi:acyl-CoA dehydrogenase
MNTSDTPKDTAGEMRRENTVGDMLRENTISEMRRENTISEMRREHTVGEMRREHTVGDMLRENTVRDMLRDTADRLLQQHCDTATQRSADQGIWPAPLWAAIEEAALHRALVPEHAGGFGVQVADALSLLKVAGAHAVPLPLPETMLAGWLLAGAGLTIPDGPLTIGPVRDNEAVTLTQSPTGWLATGTLTRIPWARDVDHLVVLADQRVALLPKASWSTQPGENIAREPRDTVHINGPAIAVGPAGPTPSKPGPSNLMAIGAAMRTQQIAGALTRLTEMTTQYAQDRVQFGRPIGKFQAVQQNLAVMAGQAAAAVAAADLAAEAVANGVAILPIAAAKARAGEAAGIAAAIAHQIHGAIGFTLEHNLQFLTRRLWSWRDEFGKETDWNRLLGRHMAAAGADNLWAEITAA